MTTVTEVTIHSGIDGAAVITVSRDHTRDEYPNPAELPADMRRALVEWLDSPPGPQAFFQKQPA